MAHRFNPFTCPSHFRDCTCDPKVRDTNCNPYYAEECKDERHMIEPQSE